MIEFAHSRSPVYMEASTAEFNTTQSTFGTQVMASTGTEVSKLISQTQTSSREPQPTSPVTSSMEPSVVPDPTISGQPQATPSTTILSSSTSGNRTIPFYIWIGVIVGVCVGILFIVDVAFLLVRRMRRRRETKEQARIEYPLKVFLDERRVNALLDI